MEHTEIEKEAELDTLSSAVHFRELLASINLRSGTESWHEKTEEWKSCRICGLAAPQTKADGYGRFPDLRRFYIKVPQGTKRYWYSEINEFDRVFISCTGRDSLKERLRKDPDITFRKGMIHEVSAGAARLSTLLRYKGMRSSSPDRRRAGRTAASHTQLNGRMESTCSTRLPSRKST